MSKETKYYKYSNIHQGVRFFRVKGNDKDVLQIVSSVVEKKGRPYCFGFNNIKYSTFIGSWGWKLGESKNISEISEKQFNSELKRVAKALKLKL